MHNARIDVGVTYPEDGRNYDVAMSADYDIGVTIDQRGRIEVRVTSKMQQFDRRSASITVTEGVAQWLGLALLRASLEKEKEQHVQIRKATFPDNRAA